MLIKTPRNRLALALVRACPNYAGTMNYADHVTHSLYRITEMCVPNSLSLSLSLSLVHFDKY